jgi:hypothetical protein
MLLIPKFWLKKQKGKGFAFTFTFLIEP